MSWLVYLGVCLYGLPLGPIWCYLWCGIRPHHSFGATCLFASVGSLLWPLLALLVVVASLSASTREQRQAARRAFRQEQAVRDLEAELQATAIGGTP